MLHNNTAITPITKPLASNGLSTGGIDSATATGIKEIIKAIISGNATVMQL
jgi:hypothetical protein